MNESTQILIEERFRAILDEIEDGYYKVDVAGNLTFFNPALARILGRSENELIGMNNRQYMIPETASVGGYPFNIAPGLWRNVGADGYAPDAREAILMASRWDV